MRGIGSHAGTVPVEIREPGPQTPEASLETVQRQLNACGFTVAVDGNLGPQTREALRFFQVGWCGEHGLERAAGELTRETRGALAWAAGQGRGPWPKAKEIHYHGFRPRKPGG